MLIGLVNELSLKQNGKIIFKTQYLKILTFNSYLILIILIKEIEQNSLVLSMYYKPNIYYTYSESRII